MKLAIFLCMVALPQSTLPAEPLPQATIAEAPSPRQLTAAERYQQLLEQARIESKKLYVWVNTDPFIDISSGALSVRWDEYPDVKGPCCAIGEPWNDAGVRKMWCSEVRSKSKLVQLTRSQKKADDCLT